MRIIILLVFLLGIGFGTVFGQEIPEEFYSSLQLYENKVSNEEIALSSNKSIYKQGEDAILFGLVYDYSSRDQIFITIIAPGGEIREEISVIPTNQGTYKVQQKIPEDAPPGKYTIQAKYTESGKPVSLKITLTSIEPNIVKISIPFAASSEQTVLHFTPQNVQTKSHKVLQWTNNDSTVHTVVSGTIGINNMMFSDGVFDSGIISPKTTFELILEEGKYDYFCRLHPWLRGSITVDPGKATIPLETNIENENTRLILLDGAEDNKFWSLTSCKNCFSNITLSSDKKEGFSSILLSIQGTNEADGPRSTFNLSFQSVDITNFDSLVFWIKTRGSSQELSRIILGDDSGNTRVLKTFTVNNFPDWTRWNLPLKDYVFQDEAFNEKSVSMLFFKTPVGSLLKTKQLEIFIDDINWEAQIKPIQEESETSFLTLFADKKSYKKSDTIFISGNIIARESDLPVTIQVFNSQNALIEIDQIIPNQENNFNFTISTEGDLFKNPGQYSIVANYGILQYREETFFTLIIPLQIPVSDEVLLQIWNKKPNLQEDYPEVAQGNLERFKEWAKEFGWKWHESLSPLIPEGQTPEYLKESESDSTVIISIILVLGAIAAISYFVYKSKSKAISKKLDL